MNAAGQAVAPCWNCGQVVQATATTCLWCGVAIQPSVTPIVVAPGGPSATAARPAPAAPIAASQQAPPVATGHAPYTPPARAPKPEAVPLSSAFVGKSSSVGAQVGAYTIDAFAVAVVTLVVHLTVGSGLITALTLIEALVFLWVLEARTGLTVGQLLLRIRSSRATTPYSPGAGRAFVRQAFLNAGLLVAVVGAWVVASSGAWDNSGQRRSLAARAAGTIAVTPPRKARAAQASAAGTAQRASGAPPATAPLANTPGVGLAAPRVISTPNLRASSIEDSQSVSTTGPPSQPGTHGAPQLVTSLDPSGPAQAQPTGEPTVDGPQRIAPVPGMTASPAPADPLASQAPPTTPPVTNSPAEAAPHSAATTPPVATSPVPGASATFAAETPSLGGALLLVFDTGQRATLAIGTAINVGRKPAPVEATDQLVAVDDPDGSVSKFHARLEHSRGQTWVTDQGSTNGTDILDEDGATRLEPGVRTLIEDGVRTRLGNRSFTVSVLLEPTPSPENPT